MLQKTTKKQTEITALLARSNKDNKFIKVEIQIILYHIQLSNSHKGA